MAANTDDELGGALYNRVYESEPCTLTDLQSVPGVGKYSMEQITKMLDNMCQIGILYKLPNNSYVLAENADKYTAKAKVKSKQKGEPSCERKGPPDLISDRQWTKVSYKKSKPNPWSAQNTDQADGQQSQRLQRSQQTTVATASRAYDCDADQVVILTEKLKRITDVILPGSPPIHANEVAQLSGLGNSRSVVNRELYFLKNNGVLECDSKANWSCKQQLSDEELRVCAADLAKQPPSKKGSSGQLAQQNRPSSDGASASDCPCPNRGGNCNHFHLHQTNNHYYQNIQTGEGNHLYFQGNGATGKRDS